MQQFYQDCDFICNELIISIILPCFNVENYIKLCLDSIFTQDLPPNLYEVICVNDCSTDNTELIIRKYQSNHNNLILVNHTLNKKQGEARNTGLLNAKGTYVWFVDSDDFIVGNCLTDIIDVLIISKPDIFQFNSYKVDKYGNRVGLVYSNCFNEDVVVDGESYLLKEDLSNFPVHTWSKIFNKKFLNSSNCQFRGLNYGEDVIHSLESYLFARSVIFINRCYYNYRETPGSLMNLPPLTAKSVFEHTLLLGSLIINISESSKINNLIVKEKLYEGGVWRINQFLRPLMKMSNKERFNFFKMYKSEAMFELNNDRLNRVNRKVMKYSYLSHSLFFFTSLYYRLFKESRSYRQ